MKSKATHQGHCQACGHLQKLPKGVLSKHGYNVTHGFFSGICAGAGHMPFELSIALILDFIKAAKHAKAQLERTIAQLHEPADASTLMWIHEFYTAEQLHERRHGYRWEQVELRATFVPYADASGGYITYRYTNKLGHERELQHGTQSYDKDGSNDVEQNRRATVRKRNRTRAAWLAHEVASLDRYIAWQLDRIKGWQPSALLPVDAKDKLGFVPTPAPY